MLKNDKDLLILTVGRALQVLILFINFKLLTIFLDTSQVGVYFLMLAIVSYFGLVLINPIGTFVNRKIYEWLNKKILMPNLIYFLIYAFICHTVMYPLFLVLSPWINIQTQSLINLAFFSIIYSFSASIGNTYVPALNILNHRIPFVLLTVLTHLLGLILSIYLVTTYSSTAQLWILGLGISYLFFGLISLGLIKKYSNEAVTKDSFKKANIDIQFRSILSFAFPLFLTNVFLWLMTQSYRPITEHFTSLEFLGFAGFGLGLASTLSVTVEYLLQQLFFPEYYKKMSSENKEIREKAWNIYANKSISIYFSLAVFISFLSPFIIRLIASPNYKPAIYFLTIGIWAECIRATNNIFSLIGQSEMQTQKSIFPYLIGGTTTLLLLITFGYLNYYELTLPFVLCFSQLIATLFLFRKFSKVFFIKIDSILFFKNVGFNLIFSLALLAYPFSNNIIVAFCTMAVSGVIFSLFQYRSLKLNESN